MAGRFPGTAEQQLTDWGRELSTIGINLQWIHGGVDKAERSFKAINGKATPIDPTEMRMIDDRKKPIAMASRAVMRGATGHRYWGDFPTATISAIEEAAIAIHDLLFEPTYSDSINTIDLPIAGKAYSGEGAKMVYDLVEYVSRQRRATIGDNKVPDDATGEETFEYLRLVRKTLDLITGKANGSLGLHPAVYYYSATGSRQPAAFFAAIRFFEDLKERDDLLRFTDHRKEFENFIVEYKSFINQIIRKRGSGPRGLPSLIGLYQLVYEGLRNGRTAKQIAASIMKREEFSFLQTPLPIIGGFGKKGFSKSAQNAAFIRDALASAMTCAECGARIHRNSFHTDHKHRKEEGGDNSSTNAAITHPFCNTGYKEHHVSKAKAVAAVAKSGAAKKPSAR